MFLLLHICNITLQSSSACTTLTCGYWVLAPFSKKDKRSLEPEIFFVKDASFWLEDLLSYKGT
jgi:hypothetical protein